MAAAGVGRAKVPIAANSVNVSYRLNKQLHTTLRICSFLQEKSQNDLAEEAIREYILKLRQDDPKLDQYVQQLEESEMLGK